MNEAHAAGYFFFITAATGVSALPTADPDAQHAESQSPKRTWSGPGRAGLC
jgi:hypothetical protein